MTRSAARVKFLMFADTSVEPVISAGEISTLLDMARMTDQYGVAPGDVVNGAYRTWYASMAVVAGEYILPSVPNDHYYKATVSDGTAGATEPTWPTTSGGSVTADGVTYVEQGEYSWEETYDVNYAIAQAWLLKAGRLAERYLFMSGGKMFSRNQFYDHCIKQYKIYAGKSRLRSMPLAYPAGSSLSSIPTNV